MRFRRQEGFKHKKLGNKWRRPKGKHSKLRMNEKARGKKPTTGFGTQKNKTKETLVSNTSQLEGIKGPVIISGTVGRKKRSEILKKAEDLGLKVINI